MDKLFTVDEIIDKNAFSVEIYKHIKSIDPSFIVEFERFAVGMSDGNPAIWWTKMTEKVMIGTVYVFTDRSHFEKFKKLNSNFIQKINFLL